MHKIRHTIPTSTTSLSSWQGTVVSTGDDCIAHLAHKLANCWIAWANYEDVVPQDINIICRLGAKVQTYMTTLVVICWGCPGKAALAREVMRVRFAEYAPDKAEALYTGLLHYLMKEDHNAS